MIKELINMIREIAVNAERWYWQEHGKFMKEAAVLVADSLDCIIEVVDEVYKRALIDASRGVGFSDDEFYLKLLNETEKVSTPIRRLMEIVDSAFKKKPWPPEWASLSLKTLVYATTIAILLIVVISPSIARIVTPGIAQATILIALALIFVPALFFMVIVIRLAYARYWLRRAKVELHYAKIRLDSLCHDTENKNINVQ